MRTSKPFLLTAAMVLVASFSFIPGSVLGLNPTYDYDIEPGGYNAAPIPGTSTFKAEIRITSDIPVDMYVVTQDQLYDFQINETLNGYEDRYTDQTSRTFTYQGDATGTDWVLIINDDPTLTANVHVEMKLLEEVGEGAAKACCGSTVLIGSASLIGIVAILYAIRRR